MIRNFVNSLANSYNHYAGNQTFPAPKKEEDQAREPIESTDVTRDLALRISLVSQIDPSVEVNEKLWAVTLIVDSSVFHARLLIEGVEKGFGPFFRTTDLKRPCINTDPNAIPNCCFLSIKFGTVYLSEKKHPPIDLTKWTGKTDTWSRSREQVELMIAKIEEEVPKSIEEKKFPTPKHQIPFSIFGRRSVFTNEVEFFETEHPELLKIQKEDPKKFAELYGLYEEYVSLKDGSWESKQLNAKLAQFHYEIGTALWGKQPSLLLAPIIIGSSFLSIPFAIGLGSFDLMKEKVISIEIGENQETLNLIEKHVKKIIKIPDNCYTWACAKLKTIDVNVPEYPTDRWIAISTLFVNQGILNSQEK
jgi:hypothetical protein